MKHPSSSLRLQHVGLRGGRLKDVLRFYRDVLGFKHVETVKSAGENMPFGICFFRSSELHHDVAVEIWQEGPPADNPPRLFPHIAFEVPDRETLMSWYKVLQESGCEIVPPMNEDGSPVVFSSTHPEGVGTPGENRAFFFRDPFGNRFEFFCDMAKMTPDNRVDPDWNRERLKRDGYLSD